MQLQCTNQIHKFLLEIHGLQVWVMSFLCCYLIHEALYPKGTLHALTFMLLKYDSDHCLIIVLLKCLIHHSKLLMENA